MGLYSLQVHRQVLYTVCYTSVVLYSLQVHRQVLYTVCYTSVVLYSLQVHCQVLYTVCNTSVVLYLLQVHCQVLYTVCYTSVVLYSLQVHLQVLNAVCFCFLCPSEPLSQESGDGDTLNSIQGWKQDVFGRSGEFNGATTRFLIWAGQYFSIAILLLL